MAQQRERPAKVSNDARHSALSGPDVNGKAIRRVRELLGISLTDMAARLHTSVGHLSNVEAGRRGISWPLFRRLCEELDTDADALLNRPRVAA